MKNKYCYQNFLFRIKVFSKYRLNILFHLCSTLFVPIVINIFFVVGISETESTYYEIINLIFYILFANIVYVISMTNIEDVIGADIKTARFTYKMLAPVNAFYDYVITDFSNKIIHICLLCFPFICLGSIVCQISVINLLLGLVAIVFANIIGYCISFIVGLLSFWLTETWGVGALKNLLFSVLAGTVFPLSFLSNGLQKIMFLTPFPYMGYLPTAILLGEEIIYSFKKIFFIALVWSVILCMIVFGLWKNGIKKYESVGI